MKKLKIGTTVNTPEGRGRICDYTSQMIRTNAWECDNIFVGTYHIVLDGDTHPRSFSEEEVFETVESRRSGEDITQRLRSWQGVSGVNKLLWSDIEEAANHIAQLRAALDMFYDPDDRTDKGKAVREALDRYKEKV